MRVAEQFLEQFGDAEEGNEHVFETEEEGEERLARERMDKRRKRLKDVPLGSTVVQEQEVPIVVQDSGDSGGAVANDSLLDDRELGLEDVNVDRPRNPLGIKESEIEMAKDSSAEYYENGNGNANTNGVADSNGNGHDKDSADGKDSFDIFSSSVSPPAPVKTNATMAAAAGTGIDDAEGYYRATIGEIISFHPDALSFRVSGIIGKGVFSTVLKCTCIAPSTQPASTTNDDANANANAVAIKLIRSNETMAKAAQKEVRILRLLKSKKKGSADVGEEHYIVKMYELSDYQDEAVQMRQEQNTIVSTSTSVLLEYHNHTALLFEHLPFNLRETLSKFGKNVGINLSAVRSYAKQLLTALQHLAAHRVVHADIKLDNILVSANFSTVKLCDFGSAFFETDSDNDPTPYLVSRFYRAPEIILGLEYDRMIDLWSVAVSLVELFTGSVLFAGRNNNDMIKRFVECIGPVSSKMIRRHILSFQQLGLQPHFEPIAAGGSNYNFRKQEFDKVTGNPVIRVVSASSGTVSAKQIVQVLVKSRSATDNRAEVIKFGEFLSKCLILDPLKRMKVDEAMNHDFFSNKKKTEQDAD